MGRGQASSDADDPGRKGSEKALRSKQSKYLHDVAEKTESDYNELIGSVKKRQQSTDSSNDGFLASINALVTNTTGEQQPDSTLSSINEILEASAALLKWHRSLNRSIGNASADVNACANLVDNFNEEKQRLKDILAAGKRVFQGELEAVEEKAQEREASKKEVEAQAMAVFGDAVERSENEPEAELLVKDMLKGVKKMTKRMPA